MPSDVEYDKLNEKADASEALVAERTRQLAATVAELESFSYSVAHDLRAPLRSIQSFANILREDHAHQLQGEALDYMTRIIRSSERMSELIDDLLRLSRIGRGDIRRETVNISAMMSAIGVELAARQPDRKVNLDIQSGIEVQGHAKLLLIAFENLLGNAWKFTGRCDVASIRVFASEQEGLQKICISDNGAGFDMLYLHKLFAPFQRLHRAEDFEGTGIGLVTARRVLARHGGDVTIESIEDHGTTVSVLIPSSV
jgi:light-regulated signal transduction histidine kinase (bacteriophytochrome)